MPVAGMWPAAASKPASSFSWSRIDRQSQAGLHHRLLDNICPRSICIPVAELRAHESSFYHLRSKIKFVFPEMRKLGTTGGIARRLAVVCLWLGLNIHTLIQISTLELTLNLLLTFPWCNQKPLFRQLHDLCGLSWIVLTAIVWNST